MNSNPCTAIQTTQSSHVSAKEDHPLLRPKISYEKRVKECEPKRMQCTTDSTMLRHNTSKRLLHIDMDETINAAASLVPDDLELLSIVFDQAEMEVVTPSTRQRQVRYLPLIRTQSIAIEEAEQKERHRRRSLSDAEYRPHSMMCECQGSGVGCQCAHLCHCSPSFEESSCIPWSSKEY